jgi:hypothetical protein
MSRNWIIKAWHSLCHTLFDTSVIAILSLCIVSFLDLSFLDPSSYYQANNEKGVSADLLQRIKYNGNKDDSYLIKLVDIGTLESRKEIANLLNRIYDQDPIFIGVDILFQGLKDREEDLCLVKAVEHIKDKSVFACSINRNDSITHSFFCDPKVVDSCMKVTKVYEGLTSYTLNSRNKTIRTYQLGKYVHGYYFPTFSAKMQEKVSSDTTEHLIRYTPINFSPVSPRLDSVNLKDYYVIVGDFSEGYDIFSTPVGILNGATIHAHTLNTIIKGDIKNTEDCTEFLYTFMICVLFAFILVLIDVINKRLREKYPNLSYWLCDSGLFTLLLTIVIVIGLLYFAYHKFFVDNMYISLNNALISVVIAVGLIKSLWSGVVLLCKSYKWGEKILRYSFYYKI